jgi:serine/threonine protein kinase
MGYMSPELLKGVKFDPQKNDIWAFGILAYKLITNKFPFVGSTFDEIH